MRNVVSRERTGKTIAEMAEMKDISIEDISSSIGVSQRTVYAWCKGKKIPHTDKLYLLSQLFGCKLSEMIKINPREMWKKG